MTIKSFRPDVISEAHLYQKSITAGITRFAHDRRKRLDRTKSLLSKLQFLEQSSGDQENSYSQESS